MHAFAIVYVTYTIDKCAHMHETKRIYRKFCSSRDSSFTCDSCKFLSV